MLRTLIYAYCLCICINEQIEEGVIYDEQYSLMIQRSITSIDRYSHAICGKQQIY